MMSHDIPTPDQLIARARALKPLIREQQERSAAAGTYSTELHRAFLEAGFYDISAPRRFGGHEHGLDTFFRVMLEIGIADPAVGWCLTLGASHAWFVASHWSEQAQRDFFAGGHFIAPHRATPSGRLEAVDGGYLLNGTWDYASGISHATHFIGNALLAQEGFEPPGRPMIVVVPRESVRVHDDWGGDRTVGMLASGSNSVSAEAVFVPAHHVIPAANYFLRPEDMADGTPGTRLHRNPMYLGRVPGPYHMAIATQAVGAAIASVEEFEQMICSRRTLHPPFTLKKDNAEFQRVLGQALIMADGAQAMLERSAQQYQSLCARWASDGTPISVEENLRLWGLAQQAGSKAFDVVDLLYRSAMSSASTKKGSRVMKYYGDVLMYRAHPAAGIDMLSPPLGRAHLGLPVGFMGL
jgi:3-hydroxy-9,10-secoandrosta-1,3,5(10)-triene-9,17-dione monooxygenase